MCPPTTALLSPHLHRTIPEETSVFIDANGNIVAHPNLGGILPWEVINSKTFPGSIFPLKGLLKKKKKKI
jgi:hypothetical protein